MQFSYILLLLFFCGSLFSQEDCQPTSPEKYTLESAINRALIANRQFLGARDNIVKAELNEAFAASEFDWKFLPTGRTGYVGGGHAGEGMSFSAGAELSKKFVSGNEISIIPTVAKINRRYEASLRASFTQPLLRGFGSFYNLSNLYAAQYASRSASRSAYIQQIGLIFKTIQTVYDIIKNKEVYRLTQESFERIKRFRDAAKVKEKIGFSNSLDVYRAETELNSAENALAAAQDNLKDSEDRLREILSLDLDTSFTIEAPLENFDLGLTTEEAIQTALATRMEIDQSYDAYNEAKRLAKLAKRNLLPDINVVLDYTSTGTDEEFSALGTKRHDSKWGIGVTTSNDFWQASPQLAYDQSLLSASAAARETENVQENIILEVKRVGRALEKSYKQILLLREQIHTSQGGLKIAQVKFDHGLANNFEVIQAEKSLTQSEIGLFSSIIDHIVNQYKMLGTIGMLADKPAIKCYRS